MNFIIIFSLFILIGIGISMFIILAKIVLIEWKKATKPFPLAKPHIDLEEEEDYPKHLHGFSLSYSQDETYHCVLLRMANNRGRLQMYGSLYPNSSYTKTEAIDALILGITNKLQELKAKEVGK